MFSFDDIEHGIIRRSKAKLGLGIISDVFPGEVEKMFRVDELDPRIHFALNCGAESCPVVRIFMEHTIDQQLDEATREYLNLNTKYDTANNQVIVTALMSWFSGDFGGKDGIISMLKKHEIIPASADPSVKFDSYSWKLEIDNYAP